MSHEGGRRVDGAHGRTWSICDTVKSYIHRPNRADTTPPIIRISADQGTVPAPSAPLVSGKDPSSPWNHSVPTECLGEAWSGDRPGSGRERARFRHVANTGVC